MNESMNDSMNEWLNGKINAWMNNWTNGKMHKGLKNVFFVGYKLQKFSRYSPPPPAVEPGFAHPLQNLFVGWDIMRISQCAHSRYGLR